MTYMNAYFPWLQLLGHVLEISEKQDQAGQPRLSVQSWTKEALLIRNSAAAVTVAVEAGFYLGSLRGSASPQNAQLPPPLPPQKMLSSVQQTISEKSSRRDEVSAHTVTFLTIVSKCTRLHLSPHSFQNISGGACPRTPLGNSSSSDTRALSPKR